MPESNQVNPRVRLLSQSLERGHDPVEYYIDDIVEPLPPPDNGFDELCQALFSPPATTPTPPAKDKTPSRYSVVELLIGSRGFRNLLSEFTPDSATPEHQQKVRELYAGWLSEPMLLNDDTGSFQVAPRTRRVDGIVYSLAAMLYADHRNTPYKVLIDSAEPRDWTPKPTDIVTFDPCINPAILHALGCHGMPGFNLRCDPFTRLAVYHTCKENGVPLAEVRTIGVSRIGSVDGAFILPLRYLRPWTEELNEKQIRLVGAPLSERERTAVMKNDSILQYMATNWYGGNRSALDVKYVQLMRGLRSIENLIQTQKFIDRFSTTKNRFGARGRQENGQPTEPLMRRIDRQLKEGPPPTWPRALDCVGDMIGIELEFVIPRKGYTRPEMFGVHVGYDGSVQSHSSYFYGGYENQTDSEARLAVKFGQFGRLENACKQLVSAGCVSNKTCGLHVHLDMRNRDIRYVRRCARRLAAALPLLNCLVPQHRWRGEHADRYCKQGYSFRNRYHAINGCAYREFQTLEVRLFNGSLNFQKIKNWIELLHFLCHRQGTIIRTMDDLLSCKQAPDALKKWAYARWQRLYPVANLEPVEVSES